ncbi:MAG: DUF1244 domain-containing protein [Gammaproteobacteria bacterium]|nr:DUF1244 domain-containing protein [Gammaproteobacteria bacterium]
MSTKQETELDAAVLRRLIAHLDSRKDVQNIELMILAGFCRNCLSKWYAEAAKERGINVDLSVAQERIYGMSYADWKAKHQTPATPEQLERYEAAQQKSG